MAFWLQVETVFRLTFSLLFFFLQLISLGQVLKAAFEIQKHLTIILNY